jgi:hypothetical protein
MNFDELLQEVQQLSIIDKQRLIEQVLHALDEQRIVIETNWHSFVQEMYGSLQDVDLKRWEQGEYEERAPLE